MLKRHLGSLDAVKSVVTVNGYVNAVPGFPDSPAVINGASDLSSKFSVSPAATSAPQSAYPRSAQTRWSNCKPPWRSSERHNGRTLPFADPTHSRWNRALAPHLTIDSGDYHSLGMSRCQGAQIRPGMTVEEFAQIDRNPYSRTHRPSHFTTRNPATSYRSTSSKLRTKAGLVQRHRWPWLPQEASPRRCSSTWQLENEVTRSLAPARHLRPFCGVMA